MTDVEIASKTMRCVGYPTEFLLLCFLLHDVKCISPCIQIDHCKVMPVNVRLFLAKKTITVPYENLFSHLIFFNEWHSL